MRVKGATSLRSLNVIACHDTACHVIKRRLKGGEAVRGLAPRRCRHHGQREQQLGAARELSDLGLCERKDPRRDVSDGQGMLKKGSLV